MFRDAVRNSIVVMGRTKTRGVKHLYLAGRPQWFFFVV